MFRLYPSPNRSLVILDGFGSLEHMNVFERRHRPYTIFQLRNNNAVADAFRYFEQFQSQRQFLSCSPFGHIHIDNGINSDGNLLADRLTRSDERQYVAHNESVEVEFRHRVARVDRLFQFLELY